MINKNNIKKHSNIKKMR